MQAFNVIYNSTEMQPITNPDGGGAPWSPQGFAVSVLPNLPRLKIYLYMSILPNISGAPVFITGNITLSLNQTPQAILPWAAGNITGNTGGVTSYPSFFNAGGSDYTDSLALNVPAGTSNFPSTQVILQPLNVDCPCNLATVNINPFGAINAIRGYIGILQQGIVGGDS